MHYSPKNITKLGTAALATLCLAPLADARHEKSLPPETYFVAQIVDNAVLQKRAKDHALTVATEKSGAIEYLVNLFAAAAEATKDPRLVGGQKYDEKHKKLLQFSRDSLTGEVLFSIIKTTKTAQGHDPKDFVFIADTSADEKAVGKIVDTYFDGSFSKEHKSEIIELLYLAEKARREGKPRPQWNPETLQEALKKKLKVTQKPITSQFQGVTLHELQNIIEGEDPVSLGGWALVNKTIVYATAPNVLRHIVDAVQHGRKDSFADTAIWKRTRADIGNADVFALANVPLVTAEFRANIAKEDAKNSENDTSLGPTRTQVLDALALDQIESWWASATMTAEGASFKSVLPYKEKKGLLTLFSAKALEKFVPDYISANAIISGSLGIDLNKAWKNLETLIQTAYPPAKPLLDMQIANLKSKEGIDLRGAVFENFGEDITFSVTPNSDEAGAFNLSSTIGIRETEKLRALLDTVIGKIGKGANESLFSERNFMGVKISKITSDRKDIPQFSYTFLDGKLYYSLGKGALENTIAEIKKPEKLETKNPAVASILRKLPKDALAFIYADYGSLILTYITLAENYLENIPTISIDIKTKKLTSTKKKLNLDKTKRPKPEDLPWFVYLHTTERNNEIITEGHILPKK
jgi:hypothetical protein